MQCDIFLNVTIFVFLLTFNNVACYFRGCYLWLLLLLFRGYYFVKYWGNFRNLACTEYASSDYYVQEHRLQLLNVFTQ